MIRPRHVVPGDRRHGVVRYAREVARAAGCPVLDRPPPGRAARPLHVHFTDHLWGADPASAARRLARLAAEHPVTVTLHDLPQESDGAERRGRRAAAYAEVARAARGVVCNSRWEVELLTRIVPEVAATAAVIPLPVAVPACPGHPASPGTVDPADPPAVPAATRPGPAVGLIGFVYPGKGHAEAIEAAAQLARPTAPPVTVVALGAVSAGHDADADELRARAGRRGVPFAITGYLSDAALLRHARSVEIPLAAHRHISASGSIATWLSAGRRPLVADSPYAREIEELRPGTILRYALDDLPAAIAGGLADPATTWLHPGVDLRPGPDETATAYLRWWSEAVAW